MEVIGIICEYNPFHNGHKYMIEQIKNKYPDSLIVLVVSSYFMQRGDISILTKEDKVKIALNNNIDLVVELPTLYACQSADIFAYRSVEILNMCKITHLIFGSECADINKLKHVVASQTRADFNLEVKKFLEKGLNYPTALAKATKAPFDFNSPNDLLGISYIKAINKINPNIKVEVIKRTNSYHDTTSSIGIISASNIRKKLEAKVSVKEFVSYDLEKIKTDVNYDLLYTILKYKIITDETLHLYLSVDEGLENKLKREIFNAVNIENLIQFIKSQRYTYNRLKRMIIHILLGIKKDYPKQTYLKILGFNEKGQQHLKNNHISSTKDYNETRIIEFKASRLYDILTSQNTFLFEQANKPIIKKDI